MGCDYYIQTDLVIVYYDNNNALSSTKTNKFLEKGYIMSISDENSYDDYETQSKKHKEEIKLRIKENTYKKMLYEENNWIKKSYEKKYSKEINMICPKIVKLVKVYTDHYAWERL